MERRAVLKIVALTALSQKLNALPGAAMNHMQAAPAVRTDGVHACSSSVTRGAVSSTSLGGRLSLPTITLPAHTRQRPNLFADLMVATSDNAVKQWARRDPADPRGAPWAHHWPRHCAKLRVNEENPKTDLERFFVLLNR